MHQTLTCVVINCMTNKGMTNGRIPDNVVGPLNDGMGVVVHVDVCVLVLPELLVDDVSAPFIEILDVGGFDVDV